MDEHIVNQPPKWAVWILVRLCRRTDYQSLIDDLEIEYCDLVAERGRLMAWI